VLRGEPETLREDELCLNELCARQDIVPFYMHKGTTYSTWFTSISIPYLRTKLLFKGPQTACIGRLACS
jgi:hypothetical protein